MYILGPLICDPIMRIWLMKEAYEAFSKPSVKTLEKGKDQIGYEKMVNWAFALKSIMRLFIKTKEDYL